MRSVALMGSNIARRAYLGLSALTLTCVSACTSSPEHRDRTVALAAREEVAAAMQRYQVAARAVEPDAIAAFFTQTAVLLEPGISPIETRDSIRAFIASFPGVRVDVATAAPDTIEVCGDMALYWGTYLERLAFPGQPVSEQHGKFVAQWTRQADGSWLIHRLFRIPIPSPPSASPGRAP